MKVLHLVSKFLLFSSQIVASDASSQEHDLVPISNELDCLGASKFTNNESSKPENSSKDNDSKEASLKKFQESEAERKKALNEDVKQLDREIKIKEAKRFAVHAGAAYCNDEWFKTCNVNSV